MADLIHSHTPRIARRWATVAITTHQLTQLLRDNNLIPDDARYHDIIVTGNQLEGFQLMLTYESNSLDYCEWEARPNNPLIMFEEDNLASNDDCLSGWEVEDEEDE